MALNNSHPAPGIIHHSAQGVQYASREYVEEFKSHGFEISMSWKGNPYDNATMESFFKTLKYEEVYLFEYKTLADVMNRQSISYLATSSRRVFKQYGFPCSFLCHYIVPQCAYALYLYFHNIAELHRSDA